MRCGLFAWATESAIAVTGPLPPVTNQRIERSSRSLPGDQRAGPRYRRGSVSWPSSARRPRIVSVMATLSAVPTLTFVIPASTRGAESIVGYAGGAVQHQRHRHGLPQLRDPHQGQLRCSTHATADEGALAGQRTQVRGDGPTAVALLPRQRSTSRPGSSPRRCMPTPLDSPRRGDRVRWLPLQWRGTLDTRRRCARAESLDALPVPPASAPRVLPHTQARIAGPRPHVREPRPTTRPHIGMSARIAACPGV